MEIPLTLDDIVWAALQIAAPDPDMESRELIELYFSTLSSEDRQKLYQEARAAGTHCPATVATARMSLQEIEDSIVLNILCKKAAGHREVMRPI